MPSRHSESGIWTCLSGRRISGESSARRIKGGRDEMIQAQFDYLTPKTIDEAIGLLAQHSDDAKILAGGHSLIPAMKLRLAMPQVLIDIRRIRDLAYIREDGGGIHIGAMTTHFQIEASDRLRDICPILPE